MVVVVAKRYETSAGEGNSVIACRRGAATRVIRRPQFDQTKPIVEPFPNLGVGATRILGRTVVHDDDLKISKGLGMDREQRLFGNRKTIPRGNNDRKKRALTGLFIVVWQFLLNDLICFFTLSVLSFPVDQAFHDQIAGVAKPL
nr:hypothetical protein [Telmatospirillum sp.]